MKVVATSLLPVLSLALAALAGCAAPEYRHAQQYPPGRPVPAKSAVGAVPVASRLWQAPTRITPDSRLAGPGMRLGQPPQPKSPGKRPRVRQIQSFPANPAVTGAGTSKGAALTFDSTDFDTNAANTGGFLFIPADPSAAMGGNHVVTVTNTSLAIHQDDGSLVLSQSLADFFAPLDPQTFTFDPKAVFDPHDNRFLVLTLERTDVADGDPANTSRIFLAVSDSADPTAGWTMTAIDGMETVQGDDFWADFPGLAVDEEAVYVTANLFQFFNQSVPGDFGGSRLWIVDKGLNSGFYDGRAADVTRFNPFSQGGTFAGTHQPAMIHGTAPAGNTGTWLVLFSGLSSGSQEQAQIVRINSPLGNTSFTFDFVSLGNIDNDPMADLANLPQDNTPVTVDAGDRRTLDAVWRDNRLYFTTTITPNSGADRNQTTAIWAQINTQNNSLMQLGRLGGEDIVRGAFTAYPSIAVNANGLLAMGFTAAHPQRFLGAWYAMHFPGDAAGSNRGSQLVRAGTDHYERDFGGNESRWGDYSSTSVDESSGCFWIYNKYAIERGTPTDGQDGRWGTAVAQVCDNRAPQPVADQLEVAEGGTTTRTAANQTSLLANDSDPDGDALQLSATPVDPPGSGTVDLQSSGQFEYQHDGSEGTSDSFVYEVCDNAASSLCSTATVNVAVSEVNDPPQAEDDLLPAVPEDTVTTFSASSLLANDDTGDEGAGQALEITASDAPTGGSVETLADGVRFTPDQDYFGPAGFSYTVRDDGTTDGSPDPLTASAAATFVITPVNDPPLAADDMLEDLAEDTVRLIEPESLLANDLPGPPSESSQSLTVDGAFNPLGGSLGFSLAGIEFTPHPDFSGAAGFDYRVTDDGLTGENFDPRNAVARVTFTITPVNDPPQPADDSLPSQPEGQPLVVIDTADLLSNDTPGPTDEAAQSLQVIAVSDPVGGTVALNGTNVEFSPAPQFDGIASFRYLVEDDGQTGGIDDPRTATAVASFQITGVNDPPSAQDDTVDAVIGVATVITASGLPSLTGNDSDPEQQTLVVQELPVSGPAQGTLSLAPGGAFVYENTSGSSGGNDAFVYRVCDTGEPSECDDATVTINLVESPHALCAPGGRRTVAGAPVGIAASALFADPQGEFAASQLPDSLEIDPQSGVIFGTPVAEDVLGSPFFVTVTSAGAPRFFFLTVDPDHEAVFYSSLEASCFGL